MCIRDRLKPEPEPKPEPKPETVLKTESKAKVSDSELESGDDGEDQVAPDNEVTKLKIDEQKEEIVQKDDADIKPEKESEMEEMVLEGTESSTVATISSDLASLKDSKEELEKLKDSAPVKAKKSKADLANVLKGIKALSKNLNLDEIRKKGKLSESGIENKTEVFSKIISEFGKGTKVKRKIKKLGVLQRRTYLQEVYTFISIKWKLPVELAKKLETKVRLIVAKDGTLLEYEFVKVSGNKIFDQSVKTLLADLEKLPPLPKDFDGKVTEIGLKFKPL